MSAFAVKLTALVTMIVDHCGIFLYYRGMIAPELYLLMRRIGRIAFPIYAFMLTNGMEKTHDRTKYLSRLILFAAVSQIPFTLALLRDNYYPGDNNIEGMGLGVNILLLAVLVIAAAAVWYFFVRRDHTAAYPALAVLTAGLECAYRNVWILYGKLNVFYTLAFSLALMCLIQRIREKKPLYVTAVPALTLGAVMYLFCGSSDYGWLGVALIIGMWGFQGRRGLQCVWLLVWAYLEYSAQISYLSRYSVTCALAAIPILLYNGKPGLRSRRLFYWAYPGHLMILGILNILL